MARREFARARRRRKDRRAPADPAGDVMILVRSRSAFFEAMIRALKGRNVKVAGADRLMLQRPYRGDGPRRRRPRGADPRRRSDARLRAQVAADRTRRGRPLQARDGPAGIARLRRSRRRPRLARGRRRARLARLARAGEDAVAVRLLRAPARRGRRPQGAAFAARARRGRSDRRVPCAGARPRAARSALAHPLPRRSRGDGRRRSSATWRPKATACGC